MKIEDVTNAVKTASDLGVPVEDLSKNALDKPTKELGEGLGSLFWLVFSPIHAARASLEPRINQYKKNLEEKLSKIPPENLIEPPLNIVGPALEAAKYYIEDDNLREMFANLIANSMNVETQSITHPAFVEVIKQLSPFDVKILRILRDNYYWPVAKLKFKLKDSSGIKTFPDDIFPFPEMYQNNYKDYSSGVDSLVRLGILSIDYTTPLADESDYDLIYQHPVFRFLERAIKDDLLDAKELNLIKGVWEWTGFGKKFIDCCFSE